MQLENSNVQLQARVANKAEAIREVANLLVNSQYIKEGYIKSMMAREQVANTYLGSGVAIPHGLPKDREMILKTGIAVLQVPEGVEWNTGERVNLVVGIAAKSDEHLQVLANLTRVLGDEATLSRLRTTTDKNEIITHLSGAKAKAAGRPSSAAKLAEFPNFVEATVIGTHGLHARPATNFVELAKEYQSEVHVGYKDQVGNGKSLVSLLNLGVEGGGLIKIMAKGPDADEALKALKAAVDSGLGDEEEEVPEVSYVHGWKPVDVAETIPGMSASPGLAIGPVRQYIHRKIVVEVTAKDPAAEELKLHKAIAAAHIELDQLYEDVKARSGAGKAAIFRAHAEFLNDDELVDETMTYVRKGHSAGWSWQKVIQERVESMQSVGDPVIAGRAVDLGDVGNRVLKLLAGAVDDEPFIPEEPVILIAEDLTPSDTASLDPAKILGFCTASGGPTSHTAIIARSLDIPAIVGTGPAILHQPDGMLAILDGDGGNLYLKPSKDDVESARQVQGVLQEMRDAEYRTRYEPALTPDGHRVEIVANIGKAAEAAQAVEAGGEGVGLMRTEFLFLERADPPSEDEQFEAYSEMVKALAGLPLIIRTLDIGGDKEVPYLNLPAEANPFLGVRGVRLCLSRPDLFMPQLRAIYRASKHGHIKIMFPMVSTVEDFMAAQDFAEMARQEVGAEPVEMGMMIEVPSAVVMARELAQQADFFSIGTNDLTQYVLAMDRVHPMLARRADGLHPAVLRMIDQTVKAANEAGKWVGVCGGVAGDPKGAIILVGLGVTELSMSIPSIAAIKAKLRKVTLKKAQALARQALDCPNAAAVRNLPIP
ncbi:MAG TPA: phosphoenolpyruvate--protein phosphotransferase [Anaerolineae bacterium]|nr:phosphoenolpyruvate--protein phosphotransferase [Anaerolineae bacterium]